MDAYILRQCRRITAPIFFGYIAIGIPFGVMIVQAGYPWWMSLFMSLVMYSGAGQYVAAGLLGAGAGALEAAPRVHADGRDLCGADRDRRAPGRAARPLPGDDRHT